MTFDGQTKVITLTAGTTTVNVRDLWSRWVDWYLTNDNSKYLPTFINVGGDPIDEGTGTSIPIYAFLTNGWRIKPQEADHTLNVTGGIILVQGGGDPFNDTDGDYSVRINYQQPVQAITVSTGGGTAPTTEEIWSEVLEGPYTAAQMMKLIASVLSAKSSGGGTESITFRDLGDTKDRVSATVDSNGNRTDVTLDPT